MTQPGAKAVPSLSRTSEGKAAEIESLLGPSLEAMGFEIVRVRLSGNRNPVLQIMAERQGYGGMGIDDCAAVSRAASAILDVEDPILGSFTLEVSSPGIDRPLTRLRDFERFAGHDARIETALTIDGRKRFTGRILGVTGEDVILATSEGELAVAFTGIAKAKLILTNELVGASRARHGTDIETEETEP